MVLDALLNSKSQARPASADDALLKPKNGISKSKSIANLAKYYYLILKAESKSKKTMESYRYMLDTLSSPWNLRKPSFYSELNFDKSPRLWTRNR
jgi:hypothetical protein